MTCLFSLIKFYFDLGLRHWEIVLSLSHIDDSTISLSTLRRHLKTLRLFRRKAHSDLLDIAMSLQDQQDIYGMLHGYKIQVGCSREISKYLDNSEKKITTKNRKIITPKNRKNDSKKQGKNSQKNRNKD